MERRAFDLNKDHKKYERPLDSLDLTGDYDREKIVLIKATVRTVVILSSRLERYIENVSKCPVGLLT
eukprot:scaffold12394_cov108-Skeletonema_marinoi.AAC.3